MSMLQVGLAVAAAVCLFMGFWIGAKQERAKKAHEKAQLEADARRAPCTACGHLPPSVPLPAPPPPKLWHRENFYVYLANAMLILIIVLTKDPVSSINAGFEALGRNPAFSTPVPEVLVGALFLLGASLGLRKRGQ